MPTGLNLGAILHAALQPPGAGTDADLLGRFVSDRDAAAFAELVQRHGPMVLGVCRRALGDTPDAEDAFQAVWLVLVRKAASVSPRGQVGNWLYGVAARTAAHLRVELTRHRVRQRELTDVNDTRPDPASGNELAAVLDAELDKLPRKYRAALVLCALEGRSLKDAAAELGVPVGTVASRLARGRARLAERLRSRGFAASALATLLAGATTPVSARLSETAAILARAGSQEVTRNVTELARAVLTTLLAEKVKTAGRLFAAAVAVGALVWGAAAGIQTEVKQGASEPKGNEVASRSDTKKGGADGAPQSRDKQEGAAPDRRKALGLRFTEDGNILIVKREIDGPSGRQVPLAQALFDCGDGRFGDPPDPVKQRRPLIVLRCYVLVNTTLPGYTEHNHQGVPWPPAEERVRQRQEVTWRLYRVKESIYGLFRSEDVDWSYEEVRLEVSSNEWRDTIPKLQKTIDAADAWLKRP